MSFPPIPGLKPEHLRDISPIPPELQLYARVEHLVGEEARLLAEPLERRSQEQRERLRAISDELDRIWETLRARAERVGRPRASAAREP